MPYGKLIYRGMIKNNMNNAQLANALNVDPSYVSKIINGTEIVKKDETNVKLSEILGINIRELRLESYFDTAPQEMKDIMYVLMRSILKGMIALYNKCTETSQNLENNEILEKAINMVKAEPISEILISLLDERTTIIENTEQVGKMMEVKDIDESGIQSILEFTHPFTSIAADNGMAPLIPQGSQIKPIIKENYEDGDIICLPAEKNGTVIIRRLSINGKYWTLIPQNNEYKTQSFLEEDIKRKILAKAIEAIIKL